MIMKKILVLTVAFAIAGFSLTAQQTREAKPHQKEGKMQHGQRRQMLKDLNLTDAQKTQLKANHEEHKAKMAELNKQDDLTVKEMNKRKAELQQEQKAKMDALFTPEQKNKMAASRAEMENNRKAMAEKHSAMLKEKLSLTDDQAAKLKAQNEATHSKMKSIRDDQSLSIDQKKIQMKAIKEASKNDRKSILTAEQVKKMDELKKEAHNRKANKQTGTVK
jgi:periplasmic protein CpxP/Spy